MPRTYTRRLPANAKRPKRGGRVAGTPNKTTVAIREAMLSVFADMQATTGQENGHFLNWALGNSTDFYKMTTRLLPLQVTGENGGPVITRIELVAPTEDELCGGLGLRPDAERGE
jgi:hypothetical protein